MQYVPPKDRRHNPEDHSMDLTYSSFQSKFDLTYRNLLADCLEHVGASTSHNPMGFHGLLQG
jgi:hypothetical protein